MHQGVRVTILGCGSSPGVPRIGNDWGACDSREPKNRRSRCALLIERFGTAADPTTVLVDTGPDVRGQLLAAGVKHLDAVIYTHPHADHIHGIDDLRAVWQNSKRLVDIYADKSTKERLDKAFGYCFESPPGSFYPPILKHHPMVAGTPISISGAGGPIVILPFRQIHGDIDSLGLRVERLAYSCDISNVPSESESILTGLDVWIVDALRYRMHPSHFSVADALTWIDKLKPKRAILTHMHTDLDYGRLRKDLPPEIEPAFDGMQIELESA
jgi:phosphoribosyl 1,2-cyclic phosphate phosphodiesterase